MNFGGNMTGDNWDDRELDRTRWMLEALIGAGFIILGAYGLFCWLVLSFSP
jgi:hypothetical protein